MIDTKELLKRISALRQRLDHAREAVGPATTGTLQEADAAADDPIQILRGKADKGSWETVLLDGAMRQLPDVLKPAGENDLLPPLLTSRGLRLLKRGKELLQELRQLADDPQLPVDAVDDATAHLHRELVAVTDGVLRTVQAFPAAPSAQMRLCEGLEGTLALVDEKLSVLRSALGLRRKERRRIEFLAEVLENVLLGDGSGRSALKPLALELVGEARHGMPLRFLYAVPSEPGRFTAAHALSVAQVLARVLMHDSLWKDRLEDAVMTALFCNIGMLRVPAEILSHHLLLDDEQRRVLERHALLGLEVAQRLWPGGGPELEAIRDHHERSDGTGYPSGKKEAYLAPFSRLLAACDVYTALCSRRPHRPALDTRTALTDTLLLGDQGILDRTQAEQLLALSFHPVGSVVELSDGSWASVVAVHGVRDAHFHPAKPVVSLLTDPQGFPLPIPRIVDLARDEHSSIVRNLPEGERRPFMTKRFPELA